MPWRKLQIIIYSTSGIMLSRTDLGMFFRRFLLGSTLKSRFAFIVLLNTILREPSLSVTMTMATFSFHMSNLIGTLVRVQLDDSLKLFWEQVEWTQQSLRLTAPDQQLHRKQVVWFPLMTSWSTSDGLENQLFRSSITNPLLLERALLELC